MRIISGEARGRRIFAPDGNNTRPTANRTREALFNILGPVRGLRFLDCFAGSGAVGLEAVSRGAACCLAFEKDPAAYRCITRNAETVLRGCAGRYAPHRGDILKHLEACREEPFDIIYLDPPYDMTDLYGEVARIVLTRGLAAKDALFVFETRTGTDIGTPGGLIETDTRRYGEATLRFYRIAEADDASGPREGDL